MYTHVYIYIHTLGVVLQSRRFVRCRALYIYIYVYTCIHIYICIYTYICIHIYTYIFIFVEWFCSRVDMFAAVCWLHHVEHLLRALQLSPVALELLAHVNGVRDSQMTHWVCDTHIYVEHSLRSAAASSYRILIDSWYLDDLFVTDIAAVSSYRILIDSWYLDDSFVTDIAAVSSYRILTDIAAVSSYRILKDPWYLDDSFVTDIWMLQTSPRPVVVMCTSVRLSACESVCLSFCLSVGLSVGLSVRM